MKRYALLLALLCCGFTWQTVSVDGSGRPIGKGINTDTLPDHVYLGNEYPADYVLPDVEFRFWKKAGNDWIAMTPDEQQAVIDAENAADADYDNWTKREKAMIKLLVKEINILRVNAGLAPRTEAQVKAALKAEM